MKTHQLSDMRHKQTNRLTVTNRRSNDPQLVLMWLPVKLSFSPLMDDASDICVQTCLGVVMVVKIVLPGGTRLFLTGIKSECWSES